MGVAEQRPLGEGECMRQLRRCERGQALVLMVLFLVSLVGLVALVLDVGSWFRSQRQLQSAADAGALAGAQALPNSPGDASGLAQRYATENASDLASADYSIGSDLVPNDRITVHVSRNAPGFFAKIFGIDSVHVGATGIAQAKMMAQARHVAPITVKNTEPMLGGPGCPCLGPGNETTLPLRTGAPGGFALVDLSGNGNGNTSNDAIADWIVNGWAAFHLESTDLNGQGSLTGYFTDISWDGIGTTTPTGGGPNYGAHTVQ